MSDAAIVLMIMALGTYALKSAGPLVLGDRVLPVRVRFLIELLPAALLAALAIVSTVGDGQSIVIDARLAGLAVAMFAAWRRAPFVVIIVVAATATAVVRFVA